MEIPLKNCCEQQLHTPTLLAVSVPTFLHTLQSEWEQYWRVNAAGFHPDFLYQEVPRMIALHDYQPSHLSVGSNPLFSE